ncbi:MAG: S1 RNA-binding domain-containing protein [Clostridia bacterium]|nr:S1 RNA-binding domain-containing protein [Clostridia bacterium]
MQVEPGKILKGKISGITNFGAFVDIEGGATGLVHISEISNEYVKDIHDHVKVGDEVEVKVLPFEKGNKISLSIKQALKEKGGTEAREKSNKGERRPRGRRPAAKTDFSVQPAEFTWGTASNEPLSFDDMLSKFKQSSDERMHDIKRNIESKRGTGKRGGGNY